MKINITKNSRRLEKILQGDVLVFPGREETVEEVDVRTGSLFTKRTVKIKDRDFPYKEESIEYTNIKKIFPESRGRVYGLVKKRAA